MTLLELASARVYLRKVGSEYHGPCPACGHGPKSTPQTSDRFTVKPERGLFFCRTCTPDGGGAVKFVMKFEGKSCAEAHALLGLSCNSSSCPAERCPQRHKDGSTPKPRAPQLLQPPQTTPEHVFVPVTATPPADLWREQAEKLVTRAHAALFDCPEQLAYLAARGLPREAVIEFRLGWLAEDNYRPRSAWGLPEEMRPGTTTPKKLWLPQGLVIPFFSAPGCPNRLRIRRHQVKEGEARYYWVPGSGDDVPVLGRDRKAFAVVESDLDAFLIYYHAGDLVGAIPLGTCSAKPKEAATAALRTALCILVATDYEPRQNATTGKHENPGGQSAQWWLKTFPRAKRLPTPAGKDPGEYFKDHGGDIRAWVLAGLPPVFRVATPDKVGEQHAAPASAPVVPLSSAVGPPEVLAGPRYYSLVASNGSPFHVTESANDLATIAAAHPGEAVFSALEIERLKASGWTAEQLAPVMFTRAIFGPSHPIEVFPVVGNGLLPQSHPHKYPARRAK